jgi:HPt (histidine-containing phosphotransfer) domain-containing protein
LDTAINTSEDTTVTWLPKHSRAERVAAACGEQNGPAPVWSLTAELQEIMDVDPAMVPDLLSLFLDDSTARLQTLNTACVQKDFKMVHSQAHSLKGSSLQMGANGLASRCAALELSHGTGPDQWAAMVRAIGHEFALVRRVMEEYLADAEVAGFPQGQPALDSLK